MLRAGDAVIEGLNFIGLPTRDREGNALAVVEAPKGSLVKFKYEPALRAFVLSRSLPPGMAYPYQWGFIPSTLADDGDPLDIMVLLDAPCWPGVVIPAHPIGVVRLSQCEEGKQERIQNDRIIAVSSAEARQTTIESLPEALRKGLEAFFVRVSEMTKKGVKVEGWEGPGAAERLIDDCAAKHRERFGSE
jgi:inorganic pyrophosphatase